eukprot:366119-Chlamydomonas_euryale.AAC.3
MQGEIGSALNCERWAPSACAARNSDQGGAALVRLPRVGIFNEYVRFIQIRHDLLKYGLRSRQLRNYKHIVVSLSYCALLGLRLTQTLGKGVPQRCPPPGFSSIGNRSTPTHLPQCGALSGCSRQRAESIN